MLGACALISGCAAPCVDDGWGQDHCPELEPETESSTGGDGDARDASSTGVPEEGGTAEGGCGQLDIDLAPETPTVMILLDRSGSMDGDFGGITRWEAIGETIFDPEIGAVAPVQADMRFGLTLFDNPENSMSCPRLSETPSGLNNLAAMQMSYQAAAPDGDTPTGAALEAVGISLAADPEPGQKIVVLATDGEPDTCDQPNPDEGQSEAVAAAAAIYALDVRTFVVSVGEDVSAEHLQDMANAGSGVPAGEPDAAYYQALDQASLTAAFEDILSNVRECTLALDTPVTPGEESGCTLTVNGSVLPLDDPNGWELTDGEHIELLGAACDSIQSGAVSIDLECNCE